MKMLFTTIGTILLLFVSMYTVDSKAVTQVFPSEIHDFEEVLRDYTQHFREYMEEIFERGIARDPTQAGVLFHPQLWNCNGRLFSMQVRRLKETPTHRKDRIEYRCRRDIGFIEIERKGLNLQPISDLDLLTINWPEYSTANYYKIDCSWMDSVATYSKIARTTKWEFIGYGDNRGRVVLWTNKGQHSSSYSLETANNFLRNNYLVIRSYPQKLSGLYLQVYEIGDGNGEVSRPKFFSQYEKVGTVFSEIAIEIVESFPALKEESQYGPFN